MPEHRSALLARSLSPLAAVLLGLLLIASAPAADASILLEYTFDQPVVQQVEIAGQTFDRVIMPHSPNSGEIGEPALPARGARILLPRGSRVKDIRVLPAQRVALGGGYFVEPVGQPYKISRELGTAVAPVPNADIYRLDSPFPAVRRDHHDVQSFRGYDILILRLRPVEYVPAAGELYYYPSLKVEVVLEESTGQHDLFRGLAEDAAEAALRVDNPETLSSYPESARKGDRGFDLLILSSPGLAPAFQSLKDYHDTTGIATEIHTTDDVGSTDPDDIRAYIRDRYLSDGIQYVLIGGDDNIIPAKDLYVHEWDGDDPLHTEDMPGDIYYGCLDGTYNYDGDSYWGEPTDGEGGGDVDLTAEVYVGRASIGTWSEAANFMAKTIWYLQTEDSYLDKALWIAEHLGFSGTGEYGAYSSEEIIDYVDACGYATFGVPTSCYDVERLYDLTWPGNAWPPSALISQASAGVHIINHYGHCNYTYALKMIYYEAVNNFTNSKPFFLYSQGCNAGGFDYEDCWAEHITGGTQYGAFAVVMNARYGLGDYGTDGPSQRYDREFWDAVYNPDEAKPELGRANQDSKEDNLYRISDPGMRWCLYEATLFGDPTIAIKSVSGLVFEYPDGIPEVVAPNTPTSFAVNVHPVGVGDPVAGSGALHYTINGEPEQTVALTPSKADDYLVTLPSVGCGDDLSFYISAEEAVSGVHNDPEPAAPRTVIISEGEATIFEDDFETDQGWTVSGGAWARGVPTGQGGDEQQYGGEDPDAGCDGPNVYGYNLNGNYTNNLGEQHLTSPPLDCSDHSNVYLDFQRWLGVEAPNYDQARVSVSSNGTSWTTVWENPAVICDNEWVPQSIDISGPAARQSTVYVRFTMGPTDAGLVYCGWNVDAVRVYAHLCASDWICGDIDGNLEGPDISDLVHLVNYMFKQGPAPPETAAADVDSSGGIDVSDLVYMVNYMFKQGPEPEC